MKKLSDKTAIITGASSGFGLAIAESFAKEGASLIINARNENKLNEAAEKLSGLTDEVYPVAGSVTDAETYEKLKSVAIEKNGKIDILINNAGGGIKIAPIDEQTESTISDALKLNLESVINGCRIIVPEMKKKKSGLIINVTSACEKFAWPQWSVYSAAKAGLSMFSRCLYAELRPEGIGVTGLIPGGSNTGFQSNCGIGNSEWDEAEALRPEHIAHAALSVATMPNGAFVPEIIVYGKSQEIVPF